MIHANGVEVIRVTNVGRVGVFSTTPNSNVVIVGNAWITTNLTVSTNITTATFNATTANLTTTITPTLNAINANITTATIATGNVTVGNVSGNLFVGGSITTGGSNGDISNVNTIYASTFSSGGVNVTAQAAAAYGQANSAGLTAELALDQANDVYAQANTARNTGNNAYAQANAGYAQANSAYGQANDAYGQANSAYGQANSAYTAANNAANTVRVSQNSGSTLSAKQLNFVNTANVTITVTDSGDGNANIAILTLPGNVNSGNSAINFVPNSSGDGAGYSTIELRPDSYASLDQYIIIDPTAPSHIHIRAGGQQDNSNASLFLGGENSYFRVTGGANADVTISANSHQFVYGEFGYGVMRFPLRLYAELPQNPVIIAGQRAFVTDSNLAASGNFGAVISGGGSNSVPVWSDGTNWRIG